MFAHWINRKVTVYKRGLYEVAMVDNNRKTVTLKLVQTASPVAPERYKYTFDEFQEGLDGFKISEFEE